MKLKNKSKKKLLILTALFVAGIFSSFNFFDDDDDFLLTKNLSIFHDIIRDIRLVYVDDISSGEVVKNSIDKMLADLDPYTIYYPESKIEDYSFMSTGSYGGIGATVIERNGQLLITEIYENYPAHKAGLVAGDIILSIDNNPVTKKNSSEIKENLKGEPESEIHLGIQKGTDGTLTKKLLKREKVEINNVPFYGMINEKVGFIKLSGFRPNAAGEVRSAFKKLKQDSSMSHLVLDLRGNPGGLLIEAVRIVNLFVEKGNKVVRMRGKSAEWNKTFNATSEPEDLTIPIAVLVDRNSASASEIVSGALQDLDRAVIIGERTYGKGLVQITRDLSYNTKLKITTAKYYIPSGRCIQALDYSLRAEDGSVPVVADSLITEFKTKNNRTVYDGGGVLPEIVINSSYSRFTQAIVDSLYIFDYVTKQYTTSIKKLNPKTFKIPSNALSKLENHLNRQGFTYLSESEIEVKEVINKLKITGEYKSTKNEFNTIEAKIKSKTKDLIEINKKEITSILTSEICLRKSFKNGEIISSFSNDLFINEAIKILNDENKYSNLLKGIK